MKKVRLREIKSHAQGHIVCKQLNQFSDPQSQFSFYYMIGLSSDASLS